MIISFFDEHSCFYVSIAHCVAQSCKVCSGLVNSPSGAVRNTVLEPKNELDEYVEFWMLNVECMKSSRPKKKKNVEKLKLEKDRHTVLMYKTQALVCLDFGLQSSQSRFMLKPIWFRSYKTVIQFNMHIYLVAYFLLVLYIYAWWSDGL